MTSDMQIAMEGTVSPAMSKKAVEVRVLRTLAELEEIRPFWKSWPGNRDSDPEMYITVLGQSRESIRPHVVVVYHGDQPDAILVGRMDVTRLDRVRVGYIGIRPRAKVIYFVYGALRGNPSPDNCDRIIREICRSVSSEEADLAYLNFLREDSELYKLAKGLPGVLSRDRIRTSQRHYTASLPGSVEEFHMSLSPKVWKNQRWNRMNREVQGAIRIECFQAVSAVDHLSQVTEEIARHSYQRGLGVGFANTEEERQRLRLKAEKGWLRGYVLYIGEKPAAFWIGDINEGVFGSDYLGFDPAFGKYSPGMYLVIKVIEGFCSGSGQVTGVDFATGHAEYKETLSNCVWKETDVYIFAPSFKGIALNMLKTSAVGADHALKRVLKRTGLLQKIKKGWRGRLSKGKQDD
jgi:hypothetical protein